MTTPITSFNRKECALIPGAKVAAYVELSLDPENPTGIILDSTWGEFKIDLTTVVKAGETITRLYLSPETGTPQGICYEKEDGTTDYISGDELSRVVSLQLLKDVDQTTSPSDGIVYQFDESTNLFEPFDLKTFVTNTNLAIGRLQAAITNLQNQINALDGRVSDIEDAIYNWPADKTTKIPRANINYYSDITNTNSHAHGVFAHDPNTDITDDTYFS